MPEEPDRPGHLPPTRLPGATPQLHSRSLSPGSAAPPGARRWLAVAGFTALAMLALGLAWQFRTRADAPDSARQGAMSAHPDALARPAGPAPRTPVATPPPEAQTPPKPGASTTIRGIAESQPAPDSTAGRGQPPDDLAVPVTEPAPGGADAAIPMGHASGMSSANMIPTLDQPMDDAPPETVDSPDVHAAWLQRIRELHGNGQTDTARESLLEFQRRFPTRSVPADLLPLLEQ